MMAMETTITNKNKAIVAFLTEKTNKNGGKVGQVQRVLKFRS